MKDWLVASTGWEFGSRFKKVLESGWIWGGLAQILSESCVNQWQAGSRQRRVGGNQICGEWQGLYYYGMTDVLGKWVSQEWIGKWADWFVGCVLTWREWLLCQVITRRLITCRLRRSLASSLFIQPASFVVTTTRSRSLSFCRCRSNLHCTESAWNWLLFGWSTSWQLMWCVIHGVVGRLAAVVCVLV